MKRIDISGKTFSRWFVIEYNKLLGKYKCKCSCGTIKYVTRSNLIKGNSKSCGCLLVEVVRSRSQKIKKICPICKSKFAVSPSYERKIYCSIECLRKAQEHKRTTEIKICPTCKKEFCFPSNLKRTYCSRKCANKPKTDALKQKSKKETFLCLNCKEEVVVPFGAYKRRSPKFCSIKCKKEFTVKRNTKKCQSCGQDFVSNRTRTIYCSRKCGEIGRSGKKRSEYWYENGYKILSLGDGVGIKEHIKVMEDHLEKKIDRKEKVVHHKNGIRDDNRIENLELMTRAEHTRHHRGVCINIV